MSASKGIAITVASSAAMFVMALSYGEDAPVQANEFPSQSALCKHYDSVLSDQLADATAELLGAVDAFEFTRRGDVEVLFDDPIGVDADPEQVSKWRVCAPIGESPARELASGYERVELPGGARATVTCAADDQDGKICTEKLDGFLRDNHFLIARSAHIKDLAEGGRVISIALSKAPE